MVALAVPSVQCVSQAGAPPADDSQSHTSGQLGVRANDSSVVGTTGHASEADKSKCRDEVSVPLDFSY